MKFTRMRALALQDLYMTKGEPTIWSDILIFGCTQVLVFGYIAKYLSSGDPTHGSFVLIGMVLWEVLRVCQYTMSLTSMWNVWSHNLSNLFIAPVSLSEYIGGHMLTSTVKTLVFLIPLSLLPWIAFDFNVLSVGVFVFAFAVINLMLFACALGMVLLGLVFRYGVRIQAIAWGGIWLLQPLMGVYFPIDILPSALQMLAHTIPATYVFFGIHNALDGTGSTIGMESIAFGLNVVALAIGMKIFSTLVTKSKISGQFARNDV